MLIKPDITEDELFVALQDRYLLAATEIDFLPLGADPNSAVYRVTSLDNTIYFLKLRFGDFNEIAVTLPDTLRDLGVNQVLAPIPDKSGSLWISLADCRMILYPFIEGRNGYQADLSPQQWQDLGSGLKRIHSLNLLPKFASSIPRESYSPQWRDAVETMLGAGRAGDLQADPLSAALSDLLEAERSQILDLIRRAERLAGHLRAELRKPVLCHADIHAGNVLIDSAGAVTIVDWDAPVFAPKERDLMFFGAGLWGKWRAPQEEEALFYEGYGPVQIDPAALAYYRYERIIQDIAAFVDEIRSPDLGTEDREQSLSYLRSNFLPGNTIEVAYASDRTAGMISP